MRSEWKTQPLGDLCEFQRGLTYEKGDEVDVSGNVVLRATNIDLATNLLNFDELKYISDKIVVPDGKKVKKGSLMICTASGSKSHLGKVAYIDDDYDYAFGGFMGMVTPKNGLLPKYLFHLMTSDAYKDFIGELSDGTNINNLKFDDLKRFPVPYPSLLEQRRIAGLLDEALGMIATAQANTEKNLQTARALFESLIDVAIQGKLIPQNSGDSTVAELLSRIEIARKVAISQGRAKPEKTEPLENRNRKQVALPNGWKWVQLESLTVGISDGVHKRPTYASTGIPFITVKNLTAGPGISFDDLNYITRKDHNEYIKRTHPEKGDILITKDGTIGVVRLIATDIEFSIFVSVALIKPVMRELGPYLVYALRAPSVQSQIVPQGAALKHLYLVDLRRLSIPFPPLPEQKRIVTRLDSLSAETQRLADIYERKLSALEALKKSLLHQAFNGELRAQAA